MIHLLSYNKYPNMINLHIVSVLACVGMHVSVRVRVCVPIHTVKFIECIYIRIHMHTHVHTHTLHIHTTCYCRVREVLVS